MLGAKCIKTCTTPQHGIVHEGEQVNFKIKKWDVDTFPYLKHFEHLEAVDEEEVKTAMDENYEDRNRHERAQPLGTVGGAAGPEATEVAKDNSPEGLPAPGPEGYDPPPADPDAGSTPDSESTGDPFN